MLRHALLEEVPHRCELGTVGSLAQPAHVVQDAQHVAALFFPGGVDLLALDGGVDEPAEAVDDELEAEDDESPGVVEQLPVGSVFSLDILVLRIAFDGESWVRINIYIFVDLYDIHLFLSSTI